MDGAGAADDQQPVVVARDDRRRLLATLDNGALRALGLRRRISEGIPIGGAHHRRDGCGIQTSARETYGGHLGLKQLWRDERVIAQHWSHARTKASGPRSALSPCPHPDVDQVSEHRYSPRRSSLVSPFPTESTALAGDIVAAEVRVETVIDRP